MFKRTMIADLPRLLAVALIATGCAETVEPGRLRLGVPQLDVVADQQNSTLNPGGTAIMKGFNPTNPRLGSAIIATFLLPGSSNIVREVTDHLTDGTPVGNTYTLVEFVTSGGISMATYVATNVQNFPDPNPTQDKVLVVQANLSTSVTTGGIVLSAYRGVQAVTAQALGEHHSAAGTGASPTSAGPGAINVGAGALAYGVTLANGVVGVDGPAGFTWITSVSNASIKADERYAVPAAAGPVDPHWTWYFNSPSTWLAIAVALNPTASSPPPNQPPTAAFTSSCTGLACSFTSTSSDPDGSIASYSWTFGDGATATLQNPSNTYATGGTYTVTLTVTDNLGATNSASKSVTVGPVNQPPVAAFTQNCSGLACSFTSTSSDPDGSIASYSWTFGDGATATLQNPSNTYATGGTYTVTLTVTDNLGATNSASKSVTVGPVNQPPVAAFTQNCSGLACSFTSTSSDPDGSIASYSWTFGDGATATLQNPSNTYATGGTYTVTLTVTDNLGATNSASKSVTVGPVNQPPVAAFTQNCSGLACSFTSTSSDPDGSIASYSWTFGDGATATLQNPSNTYATGGTYTVALTVTDNQGATNTTSKSVTVNRPPVANFTSSCSLLACSFTSTSSDPDGPIASYSWTFGDGATAALQNPSHTYATGGTYTVTLTVTDNQGATNATSKSVTVNRPPVANFT